jgi:hypothetical protein
MSLGLLPAIIQTQDMTLLLKQAADSLLVNSLPGLALKPAAAAQLPARVGQPGPADLTIRRLQVSLAFLVEDDWKELTDPQRWVILQNQGKLNRKIKILLNIRMALLKLNVSKYVYKLGKITKKVF